MGPKNKELATCAWRGVRPGNRGDADKIFELDVKIMRSTAKLADGSVRAIDHDTIVDTSPTYL